jgi:hypothetical protein
MQKQQVVILVLAAVVMLLTTYDVLVRPSNDRNWQGDQAIMPYAVVEGDLVHVYNVRNFTYQSQTEYVPIYYNTTYNLSDLTGVYFIVEPIADWEGVAHTFISFEFEDRYMASSVEARKEVGEQYSTVQGLFRKYELLYVFADEQDIMTLRAQYRNHSVFLYPINTTPERAKLMFLDVIARANKLQESPEFYNTATSTCTTNVADHVNAIVPGRVPFSYKVLAPGFADELAYDLGLIDTSVPLEELRVKYNITDEVQSYSGGDFSSWIRQNLPN